MTRYARHSGIAFQEAGTIEDFISETPNLTKRSLNTSITKALVNLKYSNIDGHTAATEPQYLRLCLDMQISCKADDPIV